MTRKIRQNKVCGLALALAVLSPGLSSASGLRQPAERSSLSVLEEIQTLWQSLRMVLFAPSPRLARHDPGTAKEGVGIDPNGTTRPPRPPVGTTDPEDDGGPE